MKVRAYVLQIWTRYHHSNTYPEQNLGHGLLHRLCQAPQIVIKCCVHHAGIHSVDGHWKATGCQLLLEVIGEEDQAELALGVGAMGTVADPGGETVVWGEWNSGVKKQYDDLVTVCLFSTRLGTKSTGHRP